MPGPAPMPNLSFNGGEARSEALAGESFASGGNFGDFNFGGSGSGGVGQPSSNILTFSVIGLLAFIGVLLWKKV